MQFGKYVQPFQVTGGDLRLADYDPATPAGWSSTRRRRASSWRAAWSCSLTCNAPLRRRPLVAPRRVPGDGRGRQGQRHQARHVRRQPAGLQEVHPFKVPTAHEIDHDYLWRASARLRGAGRIGIFNRSYYEEVLVVRVHPEILDRQKLSAARRHRRLRRAYSRTSAPTSATSAATGRRSSKFFLNVSRDEQKRASWSGSTTPRSTGSSRWATSRSAHWSAYMAAYEDAIRETATQMRPGTSCRRTRSGSRGSSWQGRSSRSSASSARVSPEQRGHPAADGGGAQGAAVGTLSLALYSAEARCEVSAMRGCGVPSRRSPVAAGAGTRRACRGSRRSPDPSGCRCRRTRPRRAGLTSIVSGTASLTPSA